MIFFELAIDHVTVRSATSGAPADFVLLDGTLAECDRVGDGRAYYSHQHRRHGLVYQGGGPWLTTGIKRTPLQKSAPPSRPSTGPWRRHGHRSNAASHA